LPGRSSGFTSSWAAANNDHTPRRVVTPHPSIVP
jgi:hypothetical protein